MNAKTKMSEKGQVVIPKDVRDRLRFAPGDQLDVVERPDGVLLCKRPTRSDETFEAITSRIRARIDYAGPPVALQDMKTAVAQMWADGGPRWDG